LQPDKIILDSVIANPDIGCNIIHSQGDSIFICERDTEEPILPDSSSYTVASAYFTIAPDAYPEVLIIDTITIDVKALYTYEFIYRNNSSYTTVVPSFDPGRIHIDGCICCNHPGDANNDKIYGISDLTYFVDYMFNSGPSPVCKEEFDNDGDCILGISDLTYFVDFLFNSGPLPVDCHNCEW